MGSHEAKKVTVMMYSSCTGTACLLFHRYVPFPTHTKQALETMAKNAMHLGLLLLMAVSGHALQSNTAINRPSRTVKHGTPLRAMDASMEAKENVINIANRINTEQGLFVYDSTSKVELQEAVAALEASVSSPTEFDDYKKWLKGDWNLLCTTATKSPGINTSSLPFFSSGPFSELRQSLNERVKVVQRIRSLDESSDIDRVDNVIEYMPPKSLDSIFSNVPDVIKGFSLNPLELTRSKVVLAHKAEVSTASSINTKLSLQSVISK